METFVRVFIRSSLVWLGAGVVLGLWVAIAPGQALVYRPAHVHATLLGFVTMMIFGVGYHVMPRFVGVALRGRGAARLHPWIANAGLALMVAGWLVRPSSQAAGSALVILGGFTSAASAFLFITNIWRTVAPAPRIAPAAQAAAELVQMRGRR